MSTVADYSFQHPDPADLVAAGHIGVMRYLCPRSSSPSQDYKRLQPAELDALHQAGLAVGVVWEIGTTDDAGGYQQGVAYGTEARSQARALGFPDSTPIYWAVDRRLRDLTGPLDYGRGFTAAAGVARPYGEGRLIDAAVAEGFADCGWMPETWGTSDHLALIQLVGTPKVPGTDDNTVARSDWGGWPEGADMTADELAQAIAGPSRVRDELTKLILGLVVGFDDQHPGVLRTEGISQAAKKINEGSGSVPGAGAVADELARRLGNG